MFQRFFHSLFNEAERSIYALGLGPMALSGVLYYELLLLPGSPHFVVLSITVALPVIVIALFRGHLRELGGSMRQRLSLFREAAPEPAMSDYPQVVWRGRLLDWKRFFLLVLFGVLVYRWVDIVSNASMTGHDVVIYALLGETFAQQSAIAYSRHLVNDINEYYYVGLHGFGFPLLRTFDVLVGRGLSLDVDIFFRSITGYFGGAIILLLFHWLHRWGWRFAVFTIALMFGSYSFVLLLKNYHIDSMRIFGLLLSLVMLYKLVKTKGGPSYPELALFGWILGASSFVHSINMILAGIILFAWFFYFGRKHNLLYTGWCIAMMLFGGSVHYVLDMLIGTGWILRSYIL